MKRIGATAVSKRRLKPTDVVTVCSACLRACCWQGEFMCDAADMAGTVERTVRQLRAGKHGEHEHYWRKS